ncbi:hypothetical protein MMPV_008876 [Pyropia vietnamensis]
MAGRLDRTPGAAFVPPALVARPGVPPRGAAGLAPTALRCRLAVGTPARVERRRRQLHPVCMGPAGPPQQPGSAAPGFPSPTGGASPLGAAGTPVYASTGVPATSAGGGAAWVPPGTGGDGGSGGSGSGGGGGGGEGSDDPAGDEEASAAAALQSRGFTRADVPADILAAVARGTVTASVISAWARAASNPISRLLMATGPAMRNRFLADELFALKIGIEEAIGIFGKLSAEYERRRERFFPEADFVFANLLTALLADFALTALPAPSVALDGAVSAAKTGLGAWVASLPSNVFQTDRPFTLAQRVAGFGVKGTQLFVVGFLCCLLGQTMTSGLLLLRKALPSPGGARPPATVPPVRSAAGEAPPSTLEAAKDKIANMVLVSVAYATFLGVSSGSRYQLVNGVEGHIFPRLFKTTPKAVEEMATFLLRLGNTFWGSQQWVIFASYTGVQVKAKTE